MFSGYITKSISKMQINEMCQIESDAKRNLHENLHE